MTTTEPTTRTRTHTTNVGSLRPGDVIPEGFAGFQLHTIEPERTKLTRALNRGDRVRLPGGAVRTVSHVTPAGYLNSRNEPIQTVHYVEAPDGPSMAGTWSSTANTSAPTSEWTVVPSEDPRRFDLARESQGFRSQEHLDAFYRSFDHGQSCDECQRPGPAAWVLDDWQPTRQQCPEGRRLFIESQEAK